MTAPVLLESDRTKLEWQRRDKAISDRRNAITTQDAFVTPAENLSTDFTAQFDSIRQNSAAINAGQIAAERSVKARNDQLKANKLQREYQAAQAQAYAGMNNYMNTPGFGAVNYAGGFGGGGYTGSADSASLWGSGGAQGVANVIRAAGFPEQLVPTMMAIAMAESSWNPGAVNTSNRNGSSDAGLFQINTVHRGQPYYPTNLSDPLQSAKAAYAIYQSQGLGAWTVYNTGKYRQYVPSSVPAQQAIQPANLQPFAANTGSATGIRAAVVNTASTYLGLPYVWGGESRSGLDCSGLVYAVYNQIGYRVPRLTAQGYATGGINGVRTSISNLRPGDLVAWNGGYSRGVQIGHIAIYAGNGRIIEASSPSTGVRTRMLGANENAFGVHLTFPGE